MALLEVKGLTKRFGGLVAVDTLDLHVENREIVGLIGPNGAGKTTAFSAISGFYRPEEGQVFFNGEEITGMRPDQICKKSLTRTFQVVKPFPEISVYDNIMVGAFNHVKNDAEARAVTEEVIAFMQMDPLRDHLAGGLPIAGRKRLEIAKALATNPKMILLDEVMAGLRPKEMTETIELVRQISVERGVGLLLVEHVMKVIMSLANRIVVIHHGKKIAEGTPEEIVQNQAVIDAYLGEVVNA